MIFRSEENGISKFMLSEDGTYLISGTTFNLGSLEAISVIKDRESLYILPLTGSNQKVYKFDGKSVQKE